MSTLGVSRCCKQAADLQLEHLAPSDTQQASLSTSGGGSQWTYMPDTHAGSFYVGFEVGRRESPSVQYTRRSHTLSIINTPAPEAFLNWISRSKQHTFDTLWMKDGHGRGAASRVLPARRSSPRDASQHGVPTEGKQAACYSVRFTYAVSRLRPEAQAFINGVEREWDI